MRQIFMTGLSACIGLVPAAFSTSIGAQVQQPLACVIVGGMLLSPICSLLVIPMLARMFMPYVPGTVPGIPMLARMFMPYVPGTVPGHETPPADAGRTEQPVPAGS
jgi:hypothetical protein